MQHGVLGGGVNEWQDKLNVDGLFKNDFKPQAIVCRIANYGESNVFDMKMSFYTVFFRATPNGPNGYFIGPEVGRVPLFAGLPTLRANQGDVYEIYFVNRTLDFGSVDVVTSATIQGDSGPIPVTLHPIMGGFMREYISPYPYAPNVN
jgi:hypothetical protein